MTQLEKILKRREEEKQRKLERERKRAEKKAEKERLKKIAHKKKLKSKQNKRAYKKRRAVILAEKKKNNDKYAYYMVVVMKNRRRVKRIGTTWWRNDAYDMYNNAVEENMKSVLCPMAVLETSDGIAINGKLTKPVKYEIMIVEKVGADVEKAKKFKNEFGKFVENVITDSDYKIIAKHDWLVEEKFKVYGYHPVKDKKTAHFILKEILLKDVCRENIKRIFLYQEHIIIQYDLEYDFISCKSYEEAERLYDILEKAVKKLKQNKYILFTDKLNRRLSSWIIDELQNKTGQKNRKRTFQEKKKKEKEKAN